MRSVPALISIRRLPRGAALMLVAALLTWTPTRGSAQELEGGDDYWSLPLVAVEDTLDARVPVDCLPADGSMADGVSETLDAAACPALLQFGPGGAAGARPAPTSWMSSIWSWGADYWYLLAVPAPLAFLGGGGGGGGGGAPGSTDGPAQSISDSVYPVEQGPGDAGGGRTVNPVPEPSTWALLTVGGLILAAGARRRTQRS